MPAPAMAATLEQADEAFEVGVGISVRMVHRVTYAGLRREMDHDRKWLRRKQRFHPGAVDEIELDEFEIAVIAQKRETILLEARIVVVVDTVDAGDALPLLQQPLRHMKSD